MTDVAGSGCVIVSDERVCRRSCFHLSGGAALNCNEQMASEAQATNARWRGMALLRRLVLPKRIDHWSLTSLQQRLVKTGGRLIKHARYYWLLLAESHLTRRLFGGMLRRIAALPSPPG